MKIIDCTTKELNGYSGNSFDVVVYNTHFNPKSKDNDNPIHFDGVHFPLQESYFSSLDKCADLLSEGGILYVYGIPNELPYYAEYLTSLKSNDFRLIFRYWIAIGIDTRIRKVSLQPTHQGLLMFIKSRHADKFSNGFLLDTKNTKVPHRYCKYCERNLKDWGGKKHLMNPAGTGLSDVWSDLPKQHINDNKLPKEIRSRIVSLSGDEANIIIVDETKNNSGRKHKLDENTLEYLKREHSTPETTQVVNRMTESQFEVDWNKVYEEDCVQFLRKVNNKYPEGIFDLVFADPPYNLEKAYNNYSDNQSASDYVQWCNEWLDCCAGSLKPGGALLVLNLPKWAIYHSVYLSQLLDFRHWIIWDAMADPRGKLLPAHYALLYFTKPGGEIKFRYIQNSLKLESNIIEMPDSPEYCLRQSCVKVRKKAGQDDRVEMSDIWFNVHRIKHRRDRDYHPCQLPEKLMDRIIRLTTDPGDKVFDPFAGVGTTALIAKRLGRDFATCELDPTYVQIANEKIQLASINGLLVLF